MDVGACHTNRHGETSLSRALSVTRASGRGEGKEKEREREIEDVSVCSHFVQFYCLK